MFSYMVQQNQEDAEKVNLPPEFKAPSRQVIYSNLNNLILVPPLTSKGMKKSPDCENHAGKRLHYPAPRFQKVRTGSKAQALAKTA